MPVRDLNLNDLYDTGGCSALIMLVKLSVKLLRYAHPKALSELRPKLLRQIFVNKHEMKGRIK